MQTHLQALFHVSQALERIATQLGLLELSGVIGIVAPVRHPAVVLFRHDLVR